MRSLTDSIIDTLAFFAIFEFPLTTTEIFNWLWQPPVEVTRVEVILELERLVLVGAIQSDGGYFFLGPIAPALERRRHAHWLVAHKLRRARRALRWATWIPFLEAVFMCNTVAFGWPRPQSDIDVFVVVRRNRLWLTRLLITAAIGLSGYRRHGKYVADRVCLSFYITDDVLDLAAVQIEPNDILLTYWVVFLHPLYDSALVANQITARNHWATVRVPRAIPDQLIHPSAAVHWIGNAVKKQLGFFLRGRLGDWLNYGVGFFQKRKMRGNVHSIQNQPDSRVVVSDTMLKFHENDRRAQYREQWEHNRTQAKMSLLV